MTAIHLILFPGRRLSSIKIGVKYGTPAFSLSPCGQLEDLKIRLAKRVPGLKHILFQEKLGSYDDKVQRLKQNVTPMIAKGDFATEFATAFYFLDKDNVAETEYWKTGRRNSSIFMASSGQFFFGLISFPMMD